MSSDDLHPEKSEPPDNSMLYALTELSKPTESSELSKPTYQSAKRERENTESEESESDESTSGDSDSSKSPPHPPPLRRGNGGSLKVAKKIRRKRN
jgi:hypothetical protein